MSKGFDIENWVSMSRVIEYLGVSRETVLQWISYRKVLTHKVGRLWKFKISEVDEWIHSASAAADDFDVGEESTVDGSK